MTLHALGAYVRYRWKARGRHGTHSPFVYDFVEQVAQSSETRAKAGNKYEQLLERVRAYYNCYILEFSGHEVGQWEELLRENKQALRGNTMIAVHDQHQTKRHSQEWAKLCGDKAVRMSIDLYGVGLLIYREEFKEKQHFTVMY